MNAADDPDPGAAAASTPSPLPQPPRYPRLDTADRVRQEQARVYRHAKFGHMTWQAGCQATHILSTLHRMIEAAKLDDLADRITALEARK